MADKKWWPRLETFMVCDKTIWFHPRPGATLPADTISAENPIALVNVRDTERVRHFKELYENYSLATHVDDERLELLNSLLTAQGRDEYIDLFHQDATSMWAGQMELTQLAFPWYSFLVDRKETTGKEHFVPRNRRSVWVRDVVMPHMPRFQWVVASKLCRAAPHVYYKRKTHELRIRKAELS